MGITPLHARPGRLLIPKLITEQASGDLDSFVMVRSLVLITCEIDEEERSIFSNGLKNIADVEFLSDLPSRKRESLLGRVEIIISWDIKLELLPSELKLLTNIKLLQCIGSGVDHVPFDALPGGLLVTSNRGAYSGPIAEHALAMTLALAKRLTEEHEALRLGQFNMMKPNKLLDNATCAIIGFGGIGKATARLMRALGVRILALNRTGRTEEEVDFIGTLDDLEKVLKQADIIILSLPLNHRTKGILGEEALRWTKTDAILVNVARANLIDRQALFDRLNNYPTFRAGLEVWWTEPHHGKMFQDTVFVALPNVLAAPHNSSTVPGIMAHGAHLAAVNVGNFLTNREIQNIVEEGDLPSA